MKCTYSRVWISHDGRTFLSSKECEQYERTHPTLRMRLDDLLKQLDYVNCNIVKYKQKNCGYEFMPTGFAGRMHQDALREFREVKRKEHESFIDYVCRLCDAAKEVRTWRNIEKEAVEALRILRERRMVLLNEIHEVRLEIQKEGAE